MQHVSKQGIKPTVVLYGVRRSVSEILDLPFTKRIDHQAFKPDQRILALWAADCAGHVLPFFEEKHPGDARPRMAIEACRGWVATGEFRMGEIRKAALDAHAAAREAKEEDSKAAAHSAGHAVATAHVSTHSLGSSVYGIMAAAARSGNLDDGLVREREWQLQRLREYAKHRLELRPMGRPTRGWSNECRLEFSISEP